LTRSDSDVLILGDMLALGKDAQQYHLDLEKDIRHLRPVRVLLCGALMKSLWERLSQEYHGQWFENVDALLQELPFWIRDGDRILVKSSHGTGLSKVVEALTGDAKKAH
ncbi:MAG: hypothetical protein J5861_08080, partial [Desulfovibrio sp.]|nr:hypothetical protein [Desulfovibrio sp.]